MRLITFFLTLAVMCIIRINGEEQSKGQSKPMYFFNWRNVLIWREDMPKEEFIEHIDLHFVKKQWKPSGANVPDDDRIVPEFPGTVNEAFALFLDKTNMYQYHVKPLQDGVDILTDDYGYNKTQQSIFIIHTISGDAFNNFVKNMMIAFSLRNFIKQYNVFAFNMPELQESMEKTIVRSTYAKKHTNYRNLGEIIGSFFVTAIEKELMKHDQIHLLGFCYSSQLASYIARYISSKTNDQKIKSIAALDPYSLGLYGLRNKVLSKNDAQAVHAYHTNSVAFGSILHDSTVDFIFNYGVWQPGCKKNGNVVKMMLCSHRRAVTLFWYILLYPHLWVARRCSNPILFRTCYCNTKGDTHISYPPVPGPNGKHYINTKGKKPYGLGEAGSKCPEATKKPETPKPKDEINEPQDDDLIVDKNF